MFGSLLALLALFRGGSNNDGGSGNGFDVVVDIVVGYLVPVLPRLIAGAGAAAAAAFGVGVGTLPIVDTIFSGGTTVLVVAAAAAAAAAVEEEGLVVAVVVVICCTSFSYWKI